MKLINKTQDGYTSARKAGVGLSRIGTIRLNASLSKHFINKGFIQFFQDADYPKDWYLRLIDSNENALPLREIPAKPTVLVSNSAATVKLIFDSLEYTGKSLFVEVAEEPTNGEYYALLTSKLALNEQI